MDEREQYHKDPPPPVGASPRGGGDGRRLCDVPVLRDQLPDYEELGEDGLRDRSSAPLNSPNAASTEVVGKIVYLRQHYHFGR
jgi:hypothetical protein